MYQHQVVEQTNNIQIISLSNGLQTVQICTLGGTVLQLQLNDSQSSYELLDGYKTIAEVQQHDAYKGTILFPFPNRTKDGKYTFNGKSYQFPVNEKERNNALHGTLFQQNLSVKNIDCQSQEANITLTHSSNGTEFYPFPHTITLTYTLREGEFVITPTITNTGSTDMPFGWGWHPYFKVQQGKKVDDYSLFFEATAQLATDAQMIPTSRQKLPTAFQNGNITLQKLNLDTCFVLQPEAESIAVTSFYCEENEYQMNIWQKNDDLQLNYLQIYTPPHRQSIAIEPQTCPADALNSGENLITLAPNATWSTQLGVELQRL